MNKPDEVPEDIWASAIEAVEGVKRKVGIWDAVVIAKALMAERDRCARVVEENMLCGDDVVFEESLLPRKLNPGNKVGLAYSKAIRGS